MCPPSCQTNKAFTWREECKHRVAGGCQVGTTPFRRVVFSRRAVFIILLLLAGGDIESNPSPAVSCNIFVSSSKFGSLNCQLAINKAAASHTVIDDHKLDVLTLQDTWMQACTPLLLKCGMAPVNFYVMHVHRVTVPDGPTQDGGLAIITRGDLQVKSHPLANGLRRHHSNSN